MVFKDDAKHPFRIISFNIEFVTFKNLFGPPAINLKKKSNEDESASVQISKVSF